MVFTIEPAVCEISDGIEQWPDETVVTADNGLCAQFEHTIAVLPGGKVEILTDYITVSYVAVRKCSMPLIQVNGSIVSGMSSLH